MARGKSEWDQPSSEQMQALIEWSEYKGRAWKQALRDAWMTGDYDSFEKSNFLQQLRNSFGPSWLTQFSLRQFNTVHEHVVRKVPNLEHPEVIARAVSHTMARRIANALEHYRPGPKGY